MAQQPYFIESPDFLRLRWQIKDGPLYENIHVIENAQDATSPQTPFQDAATGQFHPVSKLPFTSPPTSEWVVRIDEMDGYKNWHEADDEEVDDPVNPNPATALPDGWKGPYVKLEAENEFITIGEFVHAVHDWLVALRPRYLREHGLIVDQDYELDIDLWFDVRFSRYILLLNPQDDDLTKEWEKVAQCAYNQNQQNTAN